MALISPQVKQPAVHLRVQRLDPPIHDLREAGEGEISREAIFSFFSRAAVPPVEMISTPAAASSRAKSTRPVLSETESRARLIFMRNGKGS